jgi:hypothetical protein
MTNLIFATISPALLKTAAVLIAGSAAALVGLLSAMLAVAASRASLSARTRVLAPIVAALGLGAWLGWTLVVAQQRALAGPSSHAPSPIDALPTLGLIVGGIAIGAALLVSRTVRTLNAAMPSAWLIRVQVYRTAGFMFVWPFLSEGLLPAGFALPAGIGDAVTGLSALWVARAVAQRRRGSYRLAVAWNWFGVLDLVVAPTAAVLSGAQIATIYPLGLIPIFLGPPLGILLHIYSLRNLAANREALSSSGRENAPIGRAHEVEAV